MNTTGPLLVLEDLTVRFPVDGGWGAAVDGLSLGIGAGEVLALVGESGCGKTATALAVMGLLPPEARVGGRMSWRGAALNPAARRGRELAMVFQEPATALNPVLKVSTQVAEPLRAHRGLRGDALHTEVLRMVELAGLPDGRALLHAYPHQLSGGQRQRVMLAMALACGPELLLADEPTTALDASLRAGLLETMEGLRRELGLSILLVSHDLGVVEHIAQRVAVVYAGRIVEQGSRERIFAAPSHPYTRALLACRVDPYGPPPNDEPIPGQPPSIGDRPGGCAFHPRCPLATPACGRQRPELIDLDRDHRVACPIATEAHRD